MTTPTLPHHDHQHPPDNPPPSSFISSSRYTDASIDNDEENDTSRFQTVSNSQSGLQYPNPLIHHHTPLSQRAPTWASSAQSPPASASAHNSRNRLSRSHIPSLTAQGFSRPLNPQRLQAQRNLLHAGHPHGHGSSHSQLQHPDLPAIHDNPHDHASVVTASTNHNDDTASTVRPSEFADTFRDDGVSWASGTRPSLNHGDRRDLTGNGFFNQNHNQQQFAPYHQQVEQEQSQHQHQHQHQQQPPEPPIEHLPIEAVNSERTGELPRLHFPHWRQSTHSKGHSRLASNTTDLTQAKNQKQEKHQPSLGRNYEYAVGNNVFFGKGRFINSRDKPVNIMTGVMILLPCGLFFGYSYVRLIFFFFSDFFCYLLLLLFFCNEHTEANYYYYYSAPFLWHHVSPAIPVLFAYVAALCFSSFLHASLADAGVSA